jgi:hypothetical protein
MMALVVISSITCISMILSLLKANVDWIQRIYYIFLQTLLALLVSSIFFYYDLLNAYLPYFIAGFIGLVFVKFLIQGIYKKLDKPYIDVFNMSLINTFIMTLALNSLWLTVFHRLINRSLMVQVISLLVILLILLVYRFMYRFLNDQAKLSIFGVAFIVMMGFYMTHQDHTFNPNHYPKTMPFFIRTIELEPLGALTIQFEADESLYATQSNEEYFYFVIGPKIEALIGSNDGNRAHQGVMRLYAYHYASDDVSLIHETSLEPYYTRNFIDLMTYQNKIYVNTQSGLSLLDGDTLITLYTHTIEPGSKELIDYYGSIILEDDSLYYDTLYGLYKIHNHGLILVDYSLEIYGDRHDRFIFRTSYLGRRYDVFEFEEGESHHRYFLRRLNPTAMTGYISDLNDINYLSSTFFNREAISIDEGLIDSNTADIIYYASSIKFKLDYDYYVNLPSNSQYRLYNNETNITMFLFLDFDRNATSHDTMFYTFKKAEPVINPYFSTIFTSNYFFGLIFLVVPSIPKLEKKT